MTQDFFDLWQKAQDASKNSYSPYSHFAVGAAVLLKDGTVNTGCNIENRSYGLTICAERVAILKTISSGQKDIVALAIATPQADYPVAPCGACRQVISEFMLPSATVIFGSKKQNLKITTVGELYPFDSLHELAK